MVTLPELAQYDAGRTIGFAEAGRKQRTLSDLGRYAAQGDYKGAQAAAFEGGETELGLRLKAMNDDDRQRLVGQAASWAYQANSPEAWEAGRKQWEDQGYDIGPFESREALLSQALTIQDRMTQANKDRDYQLDAEKVRQDGATGAGTYGLQPLLGRDADGNIVVMQLSKSGDAVATKVPEGVSVLGPGDKAADIVLGKGRGEASADLPNALSKAEHGIALIDQIIAHPGRATGTGLSSRLDPRNYVAGTEATDFNVMVKQLQGKAFLEAFESLKGGGQITEVEGQKATEAMGRLSTAQSDEAFVAALRDLQGILRLGMDRSRQRAGQGSTGPAPTGNDGWQTLSNGVRIREVR